MKLALNQNSCDSEFFQFLEIAKEFNGIEIDFEILSDQFKNGYSLKDIMETIESYNYSIVSLFSLNNFSLCTDSVFKNEILSKFSSMLKVAYKLEIDLITLNPSNYEQKMLYLNPKPRIIRRTQKKIIELSKIADKEDIRLGLEFNSFEKSSIRNLEETKQVIKPLEDLENIGYVCDTFHMENSKSDYSQFGDIKEFIFLIQLSDIQTNSSDNNGITDKNRVFPGEGNSELNFNSLIEFFRKLHYNDMYSIELYKDNCEENLYKKFFSHLHKQIIR